MTNELAIRIITGNVLGTSEQTQEAITMAVKALSLSSAQPEIIMCKDCKYAHLTYDGECKYCDMWTDDDGRMLELYADGDFYCADAERK